MRYKFLKIVPRFYFVFGAIMAILATPLRILGIFLTIIGFLLTLTSEDWGDKQNNVVVKE